MTQEQAPSSSLHTNHPRLWQSNQYVYPVISRRSGGLSIGINLSPHCRCNFNCTYCQVDRSEADTDHRPVDLSVLAGELDQLVAAGGDGRLWQNPPFDNTPQPLRRINDIAFSGNGEPTASPVFYQAVNIVTELMSNTDLPDTQLVLITNATRLTEASVISAIAAMEQVPNAIWAKLDAGCEQDYRKINRSDVPYQKIIDNLLATGRRRRLTLQTMVLATDNSDRPAIDFQAWLDRVEQLRHDGCRITDIQLYTIARPPAESHVKPLSNQAMDLLKQQVADRLGDLSCNVYYQ